MHVKIFICSLRIVFSNWAHLLTCIRCWWKWKRPKRTCRKGRRKIFSLQIRGWRFYIKLTGTLGCRISRKCGTSFEKREQVSFKMLYWGWDVSIFYLFATPIVRMALDDYHFHSYAIHFSDHFLKRFVDVNEFRFLLLVKLPETVVLSWSMMSIQRKVRIYFIA